MQQSNCKGAGRSQTCPAGHIRRAADLHTTYMLLIKHTVKDRMFDIVDIVYYLISRIFERSSALIKIWMNRQIHIAVYGSAQHTAAIFPVKIRYVTSAAAEAYAKWGFCDYHSLPYLFIITLLDTGRCHV